MKAKLIKNYCGLLGKYIHDIRRLNICDDCNFKGIGCSKKINKDKLEVYYNTQNITPAEWISGYRAKGRPNYVTLDLNNKKINNSIFVVSKIDFNYYDKIEEIVIKPIYFVKYIEEFDNNNGFISILLKFDEYRELEINLKVLYERYNTEKHRDKKCPRPTKKGYGDGFR